MENDMVSLKNPVLQLVGAVEGMNQLKGEFIMILKEFNKVTKSDVLMMASDIVSNNHQIVVVLAVEENGKVAITEDNYVFDGKSEFYTHFTHWYYKTSSDVRNSTNNYLTLEEMVDEIVNYVNGDFEENETLKVFIETI